MQRWVLFFLSDLICRAMMTRGRGGDVKKGRLAECGCGCGCGGVSGSLEEVGVLCVLQEVGYQRVVGSRAGSNVQRYYSEIWKIQIHRSHCMNMRSTKPGSALSTQGSTDVFDLSGRVQLTAA